jgi:CheY-like chemotaxis protein
MARILVIDDDRQMRSLLRQILERDGHEVVEAETGLRGISAFAAKRADLVMIDLYMPGKSGWETIHALQQAAPGLPFVIVSGGAALEPLRRGATGTLDSVRGLAEFRVLRKPFEPAAVSAAVEALLPTNGLQEVE